jgi:sigma-E factor negative regulatory protein RseA
MMHGDIERHELVSALADGQLVGQEFANAVEWVGASDEARMRWHAYHLVGDVLRSGEVMTGAGDVAFVSRLKLCLDKEVTTMRPPTVQHQSDAQSVFVAGNDLKLREYESANDRNFQWKLVAGLASLALVIVVGWETLGVGVRSSGSSQLAQVTVPVKSSGPGLALQQNSGEQTGEPQVMIRDPHLDALLAAHRQYGEAPVLQVPARFLRNATFEGVNP